MSHTKNVVGCTYKTQEQNRVNLTELSDEVTLQLMLDYEIKIILILFTTENCLSCENNLKLATDNLKNKSKKHQCYFAEQRQQVLSLP